MSDLAIIVPTRGRPGNIEKVISAWDFTNAWDHADLVLALDGDDPEYGGYAELFEGHRNPDTGQPLFSIHVQDRWVPMVHKLDATARMLAQGYFALGFAGDDHLPQTIGWAKRYLTVLRELGTGMVYGDDGYQGAKLSTEWAMTADVVRHLGRMVPAHVDHMFCDNSVLDLFTNSGAVRYLPEIRIEHMHPIAGKAETDDQYQRVNSRGQMGQDRQAYLRWQRNEMPSQVALVRSLRGDKPDERPARRPARTVTHGRIVRMKPPRFFKQVRAATPEDVMAALADFAAQVPADQEIVEIGVFHGRTALQLAWGARQGHGAHVTGVDLWDMPGNTYAPPFTDSSSRRWAFHHVKSLGYSRDITLVQGFSHEVAKAWPEGWFSSDKKVGLLFVDGDHSKEGARRDIEAWAPHLAEDARIAVDDFEHPDWPGVKEALDELVAEGVLEPYEVFHDRLAVTKLTTTPKDAKRVTAVTSEGVAPSPYPAMDSQVAAGSASLPERAAPVPDIEVSTAPHATDRTVVQTGELGGVVAGTSIDDLNTGQLRSLARTRGIKLGVRKDKRADMIDALKAGE